MKDGYEGSMVQMIDLVTDAALFFTMNTGRQAKKLYLGQEEWVTIQNERNYPIDYSGVGVNDPPKYAGMEMFQVKVRNHLGVGL